MVRVLFVCLGNICRSPLAEGVFRRLVVERGLADRIQVDSAGTGAWHVGDQPDRRMRATAAAGGVSLDGIRARQVVRGDLERFDYVFAMDRQNLQDLKALIVRATDPSFVRDNVHLFRSFDPVEEGLDVPDPYYSGADGFEQVFDIIDRTTRSILDRICQEHGLSTSAADPPPKSRDSASS